MTNYRIKLKLLYVFIIFTISSSIKRDDDDSNFRFLLNFGYDINDLINENNEKLLNGLAIGFGFQVVGVD